MSDEQRNPDPLPGLLADIDQAVAMAKNIAVLAKGWFDAYLEAGFSEQQALFLTERYIHSLVWSDGESEE